MLVPRNFGRHGRSLSLAVCEKKALSLGRRQESIEFDGLVAPPSKMLVQREVSGDVLILGLANDKVVLRAGLTALDHQ